MKIKIKFNPEQLKKGQQTEQEHNDITHGNFAMVTKIAKAHLREDPNYYTKLKKAGL